MTLNTLIKRGMVFDSDDSGTPGAAVIEPPPVLNEDGTVATPPAEPSTLTPSISEQVKAATQEAIREAQAESQRQDAEARAQEAERQQEAAREQARQGMPRDASMDAMEAIDLRTDLYEEAMNRLPADSTQEMRDKVKQDLRQFKDINALKAVRQSNLHLKIAAAAYGEAVLDNKLAPKPTVAAPTIQPVHSEPGAPNAHLSGERAELEAIFGKYTDAEWAQAVAGGR